MLGTTLYYMSLAVSWDQLHVQPSKKCCTRKTSFIRTLVYDQESFEDQQRFFYKENFSHYTTDYIMNSGHTFFIFSLVLNVAYVEYFLTSLKYIHLIFKMLWPLWSMPVFRWSTDWSVDTSSELPQHRAPIDHHVRIPQLSLLLSCGDTCQLW